MSKIRTDARGEHDLTDEQSGDADQKPPLSLVEFLRSLDMEGLDLSRTDDRAEGSFDVTSWGQAL